MSEESEELDVIAYSGYRANERPLFFIRNKRKLAIQDMLDRWYGVEKDYFKVRADDGRVYLLAWHRTRDIWFLVKTIEEDDRH